MIDLKHCLVCLFLLCGVTVAQNWQLVNIDTFNVDEHQMLISSENDKMGLAWQYFNLPDSANEFYVQADIFYKTTPEAKLYFLFGLSNGEGISFLASGYDFQEYQIELGNINFVDSTTVVFEQLAAQKVEIHDYRPLYVYRIIINRQMGTLQAEVNGVPMLVNYPFVQQDYRLLGFVVSGGTVLLEKFRVVFR